MSVLAFDLGFRTGFAFVEADKIPISGSLPVAGSISDLGVAGRALDGIARTLILRHRPKVLAYSTPWFMPGKSNLADLRHIIGFGMVLEMIADELRLQCFEVEETKARNDFMGYVPVGRKKIKNAVQAQCKYRGWPCKDEDAADATCIAVYMLAIHDPEEAHSLSPLFLAAPKGGKKKRRGK